MRPGINYTAVSLQPEDFAAVERAVTAARRGADVVICSMHWGPNMRLRPTEPFRRFARAVLDAGADLFWGHSAHVVQGVEVYGSKLILYDTGDFVDDYAVDDELRNDLSALFLARLRPLACHRLDVVPVRIRGCKVHVARDGDREWFLQRLGVLCQETGTQVEPAPHGATVTVAGPGAGGRPWDGDPV